MKNIEHPKRFMFPQLLGFILLHLCENNLRLYSKDKCVRKVSQTDRRTERGKPVHPLFWSDIMLSEEGIRI